MWTDDRPDRQTGKTTKVLVSPNANVEPPCAVLLLIARGPKEGAGSGGSKTSEAEDEPAKGNGMADEEKEEAVTIAARGSITT